MIKGLKVFTGMLLTSAMLCSCGNNVIVQDKSSRKESTGESWTVMIYMCGSTMEENYSQAGNVLSSMKYDLPKNINVVVETGGSRSWSVEGIDPEYNQDYEIQKNGIRLVNQSSSSDMGEASTLQNFLSWGVRTYPAEHYISVIWDHGGGPVGGTAYDSLHNFDSLTVNELASVYNNVNAKFDIVGFDAGLMSNLETASALSLYSDYMVASEDVMTMEGWDYYGLFDYLSNNASASAKDVGSIICDGVKNKAAEEEQNFVSMAVTDLSKTTMLSLAFDGMAKTMVSAIDEISQLRDMVQAMNELEYMGGNSPWEGYSNLIDIGQLTKVVSEQVGSPAANIINAINEMVVYRAMSDYHSGTSGLSVYYPQKRDGMEINKYRSVSTSSNYMEFIEKMCVNTDIPNRSFIPDSSAVWETYNALTHENTMTASPDMLGRYILSATHPEILTRAGVNFYMYSKKDGMYVYLFRDYATKFDLSVNGYVYEFNGRLPMLNSTPVSMYLVSQNSNYDIYSIPIIYDGKITNLRVSKSKMAETLGEYSILGVWDGIDGTSKMAERKYTKLYTGDVIIPIYRVYGKDETTYVEGNKIRIGFGGINITEKLIDDGDYIVSYTAEDVYGVNHECDTNNLVASKGTIKIMDY